MGGPRDGDLVIQTEFPVEEYFINMNRKLSQVIAYPVVKEDTPENSEEFHFYRRRPITDFNVYYEYQGINKADE